VAAVSAGSTIATATGPIELSGLGRTLVDEHVVRGLDGFSYWEPSAALTPTARAELVDALAQLRAAGVDTIVDTTAVGAGRDAALLREVSDASGVRIVVGIGLASSAAGVPQAFRELEAVELAEVYLRELAGETTTGVAAAVITIDVAEEPQAFDELAVLAVGFAHAETRAPVLARAPARSAHWIVDRLAARGIEPARILLGVDTDTAGWVGLDALARKGVVLGVTRIGHDGDLSEEARASLLAYLLRTYGDDRVCLSMGSWGYWLGAAGLSARSPVKPRRGFGYLREFKALASSHGVDARQFEATLVNGPRFWLQA
jgi:phosphotriesterase-related protein